MPPKRTAAMGRMVLYFHESERRYFPAVIVAVHTPNYVNLAVFTDLPSSGGVPMMVTSCYLHEDGASFHQCPVGLGHVAFWPPLSDDEPLPEWPQRSLTAPPAQPVDVGSEPAEEPDENGEDADDGNGDPLPL